MHSKQIMLLINFVFAVPKISKFGIKDKGSFQYIVLLVITGYFLLLLERYIFISLRTWSTIGKISTLSKYLPEKTKNYCVVCEKRDHEGRTYC